MTLGKLKSPFYIVEEFLSPYLCEQVVDLLNYTIPDVDIDDNPVKSARGNQKAQDLVYDRLKTLVPVLMEHYGTTYHGTEKMLFEWFPCGSSESPKCDNSEYISGKWTKTVNRDISICIFLSDYNDSIPFDNEFECYGGKLEFPQHQFGFNPQRGTLIAFPSVPHFTNNITTIEHGDLYMCRSWIATKPQLIYNPNDYKGDYTTWFKDHM